MSRARRRASGLVAVIAAASACAVVLGERYKPLESVPATMAVVYLYAGPDVSGFQTVIVDRDPLTPTATHSITLLDESYYAYLMTAGPVRLMAEDGESMACVSLEPRAGHHYWARVGGPGADPRVVLVSADEAEAEMSGFRRVKREAKRETSEAYSGACTSMTVSP